MLCSLCSLCQLNMKALYVKRRNWKSCTTNVSQKSKVCHWQRDTSNMADLIATVERLSVLLGPPVNPPQPLKPMEGFTRQVPSQRQSLLLPQPQQPQLKTASRRPSMMRAPPPPPPTEPKTEALMDVGEVVMTALTEQMEFALAERVSPTLMSTLET